MVNQPCHVHRPDLLTTPLSKCSKRTMAGAVTHNDIWKAAMISVTIRSWEPLTDHGGTLNITRPHNANTSRMNLLQKNPSNDGDKCVQFNQTARKKRNDCVRDPVTNKKTLTTTQSNLLSSIKAAKCSSRDHTTQRKHWWTLALFFFLQRRKLETYHHVIPSFWEGASRTSWWYDVLHKTTQCNNKTNDCSAAHTRQLNKMPPCNQVFRGNVLQVWRPMVCITRPHCANIAMILAGTSSQSRKHHVNQTRVQMSSRNPGGVVCFRHGTLRENVVVFNNPSQKHTWMASTMPTITCQRKPLRSWWYGVHHKNIQYECSNDHPWDLITYNNTEQVPYAHQHVWTIYHGMPQREVCEYPETTQCNIYKDNHWDAFQ